MVALESTGAFVLALILSLSQFVEPLDEQTRQSLLAAETTETQQSILEFQPKSIAELENLSNEELGFYIRFACARLRNEVTREDLERGIFQDLSLVDTVANLDLQSVFGLSSRLLPEEEFDVRQGLRIMITACEYMDHRFGLDVLTRHDLRLGLEVYKEFASALPQWQTAGDLPGLPEIVVVNDSQGRPLTELVKKDTLRVETGEIQTLRVHRRQFASSEEIPLLLKKAIVAVEDARFWNFQPENSSGYEGHLGVDLKGLMRAATSTASGEGMQGASTITMQLVKNYILYEDVHREYRLGRRSVYRKLKEYILSRRVEQLLSKDQILTLYLNTIDFGAGVQGVKMAAKAYFDKQLAELELHEIALLAALPKGPSYYNPWRNSERASARRNYALIRMQSEGYISASEKETAVSRDLGVIEYEPPGQIRYDEKGYYLAEVQNLLWSLPPGQGVFEQSAANEVTLFMNEDVQRLTSRALQRGLINFERASGNFRFRNQWTRLPNIKEPVQNLADEKNKEPIAVFGEVLEGISHPLPDATQFEVAVFLGAQSVGFSSGRIVKLNPEDAPFLRKTDYDSEGNLLRAPLEVWDVVLVEQVSTNNFRLAGVPRVTGAMIVVENATGKVLASSGGFSLGRGSVNFGPRANLAFRASRQPGSTLKPFLYLLAFESGLSPETVVSNLPIRFPERYFNGHRICDHYRPSAFSGREREAISIERAFKYSRNLAAAHTLNAISGDRRSLSAQSFTVQNPNRDRLFTDLTDSLDQLWDVFKYFGVYDRDPHPAACFSSLLGAEEVTPAKLAKAYAGLARGGRPVELKLFAEQPPSQSTALQRSFEIEVDPYSVYQVQQMMQLAVKEGTARRLADYHELVAGKTGTTNGNKDVWFAAITKDITVVTWVGYPDNERLGSQGEGGKTAVPIFKDFFENYLALYPEAREKRFEQVRPPQPTVVEARFEPRSDFFVTPEMAAFFLQVTGRQVPTETRRVQQERLNSLAPTRFQLLNDEVLWRVMCDNLSSEKEDRVIAGYLEIYEEQARSYHEQRRACESDQRLTGHRNHASCERFEELERTTPNLCEYFYDYRAYFL